MIVFAKVRRCSICQVGRPLQELHAMVWDIPAEAKFLDESMRMKDYGSKAMVFLESIGAGVKDVKSVYRHVQHVEKSARVAPASGPSGPTREHGGERRVVNSDYRSITDMAAELGVLAMDGLKEQIEGGFMEARDLVATAKMGVVARAEQEKLDRHDKRQHDLLDAIQQLASGHIGELPEGEIFDGVAVEVLSEEVRVEREALLLAAGT